MTTLILGSTGRVGFQLTKQLLERGRLVRALVRSPEKLKSMLDTTKTPTNNLEIVYAEVTKLTPIEFQDYLSGCNSVAIALGHNLNFTGLFKDEKFVSKVTENVFTAAEKSPKPSSPVKFVILSTPGFIDKRKDASEVSQATANMVLSALNAVLVPPSDNMAQAMLYLSKPLTDNIEWCAIRPYNFIEIESHSEYLLFEKLQESILASRNTSIVNIGHLMSELIENDETWSKWKGKAVIMRNADDTK